MKRINHKIFGIMMALLPSLFLFSCEIKQQGEDTRQGIDTSSIIDNKDKEKEIKISVDTLNNLIARIKGVVDIERSITFTAHENAVTPSQKKQNLASFKEHLGATLDSLGHRRIVYVHAILDTLEKNPELITEHKNRLKGWLIPQMNMLLMDAENIDSTAQQIEEASGLASEAAEKAEVASQLAHDALNKYESLNGEIETINTNIENLEKILNEKYGIVGVGVVGLIVVVISVFISIFIANKFINEAIKESKDNKPTVYNYNNSNEIKTLTNRIHKLEDLVKRLESQIKNLELSKPQIQKTPPPFEQPQKKVQESKMEKKQEPESFVCEYLGNREGVKLHECKNSPDGESLFKVIWTSPDKSIGEIDIIDFDKVKYEESVQEFVEVIEGCSFSTATTYQTISKGRVKKDGSCWILDSKIKIRNIK